MWIMRRIRHNEIGKNLELSLLNHCINIYVETIGDKTLNIFGKPKSLCGFCFKTLSLLRITSQKEIVKDVKSVPFCTEKESVEHLFSGCTTAKYIWSLIACALGVSCRPCNIDQFWVLEYLFPTCTCRLLQAGLALWVTLYPLFICNPLVILSLSESKSVGIPLSWY